MKRIIFIILLSIIPACLIAQEKYCFDSVEVKAIEASFDKLDYLQIENDSLYSVIRLKDLRIMNDKDKIIALNEVIHQMDLQLVKLENFPKEIIKQSNYAWYEIAFLIAGSFAIGFAVDRILK